MSQIVLKIHGLDCAQEAALLIREVGPLVGGRDALAFDYMKGRMIVTVGPRGPGLDDLVSAVTRAGMQAEVWEDRPRQAGETPLAGKSAGGATAVGRPPVRLRTLATLASALLTVVAFAVHVREAGFSAALGSAGHEPLESAPLAAALLYAAAVVAGGSWIAPKAWRALVRLRPDMNLLMTIAVLGAMGIGEWFEAATVTFLFALSLELESWSVGRARRAVESLLKLAPTIARIRRSDGTEEIVPPDLLQVGDHFIVKPGERVPLDGIILAGLSEVDQAPITGESLPVAREPGDAVFAGTINGGGALEVECTHPVDDTTLHHIIRMVEEAQTKRSPSERWVDRFARLYTPTVLAVAALVLLVPPLLFQASWETWLYRSLVLLVIGCPCALVISTPVSIAAALAAAAHHGVLVKSGDALETASRLKAVAFDKTGTLTEGKLSVVEVVPFDHHDERELLERASAMEARSGHPFAQAVVSFSKEKGIAVLPASEFQVVPGRGATGVFDGRPYWLGSHRYLEERGQETSEVHAILEELGASGKSVAVIGNESHVCGFIAAADRVRPEAREAVADLRGAGIGHIVMLTGDNPGTARAIGRESGVDDVRADLLPEEKVATVEQLVASCGAVGMVGDGVNDAPAMARATLSIAMGAAGSDAAIEAADVALMSDDLAKIPWLVRHSRRTLGIIRQNITFSLLVKLAFLVLTLAGHASLWAAIAADMGASLIVISNGLRLLRPADRRASGTG